MYVCNPHITRPKHQNTVRYMIFVSPLNPTIRHLKLPPHTHAPGITLIILSITPNLPQHKIKKQKPPAQ